MNKKISVAFVVIALGLKTLFSYDAQAKSDPELAPYQEFVTSVGNEIIQILIDKNKPMADRKDKFRQVLKRDFSIPSIGKFVLASYWRRATPEQKKEYLELFEDAIVENYSAQFDNYSNERLDVRSARRTKDGGVIVKSVILRPQGGEPLHVDWKVFKTKDSNKVLDLVVNGVSMSITQRSEYRAIIRANGGKVEGLLKALRKNPPKSHIVNPS